MAAVVEELAEPQYIGATVGATLVVGADEQLVKLYVTLYFVKVVGEVDGSAPELHQYKVEVVAEAIWKIKPSSPTLTRE